MPYKNRTYALTSTQLDFGIRFESMRLAYWQRHGNREKAAEAQAAVDDYFFRLQSGPSETEEVPA